MLEDLKEFIAYRFDELHEDINGICEEIKEVKGRVSKLEKRRWFERGIVGATLVFLGLKGFKF